MMTKKEINVQTIVLSMGKMELGELHKKITDPKKEKWDCGKVSGFIHKKMVEKVVKMELYTDLLTLSTIFGELCGVLPIVKRTPVL